MKRRELLTAHTKAECQQANTPPRQKNDGVPLNSPVRIVSSRSKPESNRGRKFFVRTASPAFFRIRLKKVCRHPRRHRPLRHCRHHLRQEATRLTHHHDGGGSQRARDRGISRRCSRDRRAVADCDAVPFWRTKQVVGGNIEAYAGLCEQARLDAFAGCSIAPSNWRRMQ